MMAESLRRKIKEWIVADIARDIKGKDCILFVDVERITAGEMTDLRTYLRSKNVRLKVAKNSLIKRALKEVEKPQPSQLLSGMTALVWGDDDTDPITVCRSVVDWHKKEGFPRIKGAIFLEKILDEAGTFNIAKLPTRKEMMGQVLTLFQNSLAGVVNVMEALLMKLLACFENLAEKMEKEGKV